MRGARLETLMKADAFLIADIEIDTVVADRTVERLKRRWQLYLLLSTIAATMTALAGLILAAASLLRLIGERSDLSIAGSVILAATFPLLVFAAHCLDRIDDAKRALRVARFRRRLLKNVEW